MIVHSINPKELKKIRRELVKYLRQPHVPISQLKRAPKPKEGGKQ